MIEINDLVDICFNAGKEILKIYEKTMRRTTPKKSWKLMKKQCENGSGFD